MKDLNIPEIFFFSSGLGVGGGFLQSVHKRSYILCPNRIGIIVLLIYVMSLQMFLIYFYRDESTYTVKFPFLYPHDRPNTSYVSVNLTNQKSRKLGGFSQ